MRGTADLDRFARAQDDPYSGIDAALAELRAGQKQGHWIWYVFPQLAGLGMSAMSQRYAIADLDEAIAYLSDPVLGQRLHDAVGIVVDQLTGERPVRLDRLMGSELDARKLISSLTLFREAAREMARASDRGAERILAVAERVLAAARGQGYEPCDFTIRRLREERGA